MGDLPLPTPGFHPLLSSRMLYGEWRKDFSGCTITAMETFEDLPLFPLNTVLFPGQLLPLRIFESRYLQMVRACLAGTGQFGVVLIRKGLEVGGPAEPYAIGTIARIQQVEGSPDGEMQLLCLGEQRMRVRSWSDAQPYLSGEVEVWPWETGEDEGNLEDLQPELREHFDQYLQTLGELAEMPLKLEHMPNSVFPMAILAAIVLRVPNSEKQELLATETMEGLILACIRLLTREISALKATGSLPHQDLPPVDLTSPN